MTPDQQAYFDQGFKEGVEAADQVKQIEIRRAQSEAIQKAAKTIEDGPLPPIIVLVEGRIRDIPEAAAEYRKSLATIVRALDKDGV